MNGYTLTQELQPRQAENIRMVTDNAKTVYLNWPRKIEDIVKPINKFEGKRCFLIGGGESLKHFDFSKLNNEITIGINRSFEYYESTFLYMMDICFHDQIVKGKMNEFTKTQVREKWNAYKNPRVMLCPVSPYPIDPNVYFVKRLESKTISLEISEGIYGGSNSGFGALMLAIALGMSPIYLLGYDMRITGQTHWHSGYPGQTFNDQQRKNQGFADLFKEFAEPISKLGFKVINLNPFSELKCFDFGVESEVLK